MCWIMNLCFQLCIYMFAWVKNKIKANFKDWKQLIHREEALERQNSKASLGSPCSRRGRGRKESNAQIPALRNPSTEQGSTELPAHLLEANL